MKPQSPRRTAFMPKIALCAWMMGSSSLVAVPIPGASSPASVDVLICYNQAPGDAQIEELRLKGGIVYRSFRVVPAVAARIPHSVLNYLRRKPEVLAVEPDGRVEAHAESDAAWGVLRIGCLPIHAGAFPGAEGPVLGTGSKVAVIDTGVDYLHPDLAANFAGGYDFVNGDSDPMDDNGHGTHVSGIVAASRNGMGMMGVAPSASLYALKVLGSNGVGSWSGIIAALDWSLQQGISVANLSLGSIVDPGFTVRTAFDNAERAGLFVVASAGNSGPGTDTVNYPAKFDSVVAVSSTTVQDGVSNFSSTGPSVELAAPGSAIYSTLLGGGYGYLSGTSMAAPHVAGVAALALSHGVFDFNGDGHRNDDLRRLLQVTAEDLGPEGRDDGFGFGLVDAGSAVTWSRTDPEQIPWFQPPTGLALVVDQHTITLTWYDNSTMETGFEVQSAVVRDNSLNWGVWGTTSPNTTQFSGVLGKGLYRFRVRARLDGQSTAWSNEVQIRVH